MLTFNKDSWTLLSLSDRSVSASHYRSSKSLELSVLFSAQPDSNEQKIAVAISPPTFNFFLLFQASSVLLPFGFKANGNGGEGNCAVTMLLSGTHLSARQIRSLLGGAFH